MLNNNTWNHLTVCKQIISDLFKNSYIWTILLQIKLNILTEFSIK